MQGWVLHPKLPWTHRVQGWVPTSKTTQNSESTGCKSDISKTTQNPKDTRVSAYVKDYPELRTHRMQKWYIPNYPGYKGECLHPRLTDSELTGWMNNWMKIYKWHLTISTQNNVCSQHQEPQQAKNTITLGQYNQKKKTHSKNPDQKHRHT